ncbi:MAG: molybdenum cofactor guanylyltransferase [Mycobacteriaceae bacterium]
MTKAQQSLAGIILTGGQSRRMGADKARIPWCDTSLVEHVVGVVAALCDPVFIISAVGQEIPHSSAKVLTDTIAGQGPLHAVGVGLEAAAQRGVTRAFVAATDMPLLNTAVISELWAADPAQVVMAVDDQRGHPLAAIYHTELFARAHDFVTAGRRSLMTFVDGLEVNRIMVANSLALTNVNTPDELLRARAAWTQDTKS